MPTLTRIIASLALLFCSALAHAEEEFPKDAAVQEAYIQRFIDARLMATPPRFEELEQFARDLQSRIERHEAYERALSTFYGYLGIQAATMQWQPAILAWRQKNPAAAMPALATINGRFIMAMEDLFLALASNWVWHPLPNGPSEIEAVREELLGAKAYASSDPIWYVLMAQATVALKRDRSELDQLVEEGLKKFPKHYDLIMTAAAGYLGKWGGNAQSLEAYAQHVLALSAPDDGIANYARIYDVALRAQYGVLMFDLAKPDWALLMASVRELIKQAPTREHLNVAAVMACAGGNRALTRDVLQHAKFSYTDSYWYNVGTASRPYEICRSWAGDQ